MMRPTFNQPLRYTVGQEWLSCLMLPYGRAIFMRTQLTTALFNRRAVLTTWMLWQHLLYPGAHPLYQRVLRLPHGSYPTSVILMGLILVASPICGGIWLLLNQFGALVALILLAAMLCFSSSYGVIWVMRLAVTIATAHEQRTYDELCLPPAGALGANWAICAATWQRGDMLGWIDLLRKVLAGLLLFVLLLVLSTMIIRAGIFNLFQVLQLLVEILLLTAAVYAEHLQSIVLGSLVGMIVPLFARTRLDARLLSAAVFLTLQSVTVLATVLIVLALLALPLAAVSPTIVSVLVFYVVREGCNAALWTLLTHQLNADPAELTT